MFLRILSIIAIGLTIILISIFKNPVRNMQQKNYNAQINPFSVVLSDKNGDNPVGISPLNDFLYSDSKKDHFVDVSFTRKRDYIDEVKLTFERLILRKQKLIWKIAKDKFAVTYEITGNNQTVRIDRNLENLPPGVNAIGQALTLCKGCLLSDKDRVYIYLKEDRFTPEALEMVKKLHLIPLIIPKQFPVGIQKILVLKPDGQAELELEVSPDQEINFLQDWNILELKTPMPKNKNLNLYQTLRFL